ncbi:MAG: NAD(P)/FAD-dependent oxidoreductase [Alphaproteobacteria bacterium]
MSGLADRHELIVVGAGPAGLAAATAAAGHGVDVALLDEQAQPGGQIYRAVGRSPVADRAILGEDYHRGADLLRRFADSGATYVPGATVWHLGVDREIGVSVGGAARLVGAGRVIVATGAMERPFPIPGWTLPGVMGAGAGQLLLKSAGLVPAGCVVLAGLGPLLYLVAAQYLRAGVEIAALLETTPRANRWPAAAGLPGFLASGYFAKGRKLLAEVRARVRRIGLVETLRAEGGDRLQAVTFGRGGERETIPADLLLLHQGVVPNVNLAMAAGADHGWDAGQLCFRPAVDEWGESSLAGIAVAGDGAGIGGAQAAEHRGRLAGLAAAHALGRIGREQRDWEAAGHRRRLARALRGRSFLDRLYRPPAAFRRPTGDTIVCRCEELTADRLLETVREGQSSPNQLKSLRRPGMGPCQGRFCGLTVTELLAAEHGTTPEEVGYYRIRPPVKPLSLAELADLSAPPPAAQAEPRP